MSDDAPRNDEARHRYVLETGSGMAIAAYLRADDTITFTHTEVPPALQGGGIASRLVRFALDDVRARGFKVVPQCAFVAAYIARHPQDRDLLAG